MTEYLKHPDFNNDDVHEIIATFAPDLHATGDYAGLESYKDLSVDQKQEVRTRKIAARALTIAEIVNNPTYQKNMQTIRDAELLTSDQLLAKREARLQYELNRVQHERQSAGNRVI